MQLRRLATEHGVDLGAVVLVVVVAGLYVHAVRTFAGSFGFPLDDGYIYLTYARQIARGRPFTYFDGSGYTAGATSMLWPVVIAPLWAIGFRGSLFAPVVFGLCALLLAGTAMLAWRIGRQTLGSIGGICAGALILFCAPLGWAYLAGMEVGLAGILLLASALALIAREPAAPPGRGLLILLAATSIARPEMAFVVAPIVGGCALAAARRKRYWDAGRWLTPMLAPLCVGLMNRAFAGHFVPNTAIAKSHLYMPGFTTAYWEDAVKKQGKKMFEALFWKELPQNRWWMPRLMLALWLLGAGRLAVWAWEKRRFAGVALLVLSGPLLLLAVLLTSALWSFQNYRYIAPAMAPIMAVCGLALAPPKRLPRPAFLSLGVAAAAFVAFICGKNWPRLEDNARMYAQGVRDMNAQTVRIGKWIDGNLPADARIALHDVGAVGYFAHRKLIDVIGLVTNHQAEICHQGPGSRFEWLERLPPDRRPTHFVYYGGWLLAGSRDLYGKTLMEAKLLPPIAPQLVGGSVMQVMEADLSLLGSGEAPLEVPAGWKIVDTVDVADVESEHEHHYSADLGPRFFGALSDQWSCYYSATQPTGDGQFRRMADGCRMIRAGGEDFVVHVDPKKPMRLVVRTGAPVDYKAAPIGRAAKELLVERTDTHAALGTITLPAPSDAFAESFVELAADATRPPALPLGVRPVDGRVRTFHYWVLQPPGPLREAQGGSR